MNLSGANCLVLGGAGFIGSHVVTALLEEGVGEVRIYDNLARGDLSSLAPSLENERCSFYGNGGDIRDVDILNDAMRGIDCVFHLAAMWLLHCRDFPRTAFHINVEGTFNVLEACVRNKVDRLIYSSSASVYGNALEVPMREDHPFCNRNFYGATKIAGEAMCRSFHDRYGLNYVGLRYMNVYGPHQDQYAAYSGVIPSILNNIDADRRPVVNGDGSQAYDFIDVRDAARSNILALQAETTDEFYNVGTGVQTSVRELCNLLLELRQSDLAVSYKPYSKEDSRSLVQNRIGCPEKAKLELGFEHRVNLREGLEHLIEWRESRA